MYKSDDILEAARTIRPYLKELLPIKEAEAINQQLADLLAQANTGQPVDHLIMELLADQDATREWLLAFLNRYKPQSEQEQVKGLAGDISLIPLTKKFVCPHPQCDYIWYLYKVGVNPPPCPIHNQDLDPDPA